MRSLAPPLGRAGAVLAALTVPVVVAMQLVPPWSRVDPVRRTISEYALGPGGWLFDAVVVALALASVAVAAALVGSGLARVRAAPAVLLAVWVAGLLLVVVFEKTNWAVGPSLSGYVHRYASLAAFLALPTGALLLTRGAAGWRARAVTVCALAAFAPFLVALATALLTGAPWYRAVPLGIFERVLAVAEVGVVVALGLWAAHAAVVVTRREPTGVRPLVPGPSPGA